MKKVERRLFRHVQMMHLPKENWIGHSNSECVVSVECSDVQATTSCFCCRNSAYFKCLLSCLRIYNYFITRLQTIGRFSLSDKRILPSHHRPETIHPHRFPQSCTNTVRCQLNALSWFSNQKVDPTYNRKYTWPTTPPLQFRFGRAVSIHQSINRASWRRQ